MMNSMLWMGEKPLCTLTFPVRLSRVRCTCAVCSCLYLQQQTGTRLPCSGRGCGGPVRTRQESNGGFPEHRVSIPYPGGA